MLTLPNHDTQLLSGCDAALNREMASEAFYFDRLRDVEFVRAQWAALMDSPSEAAALLDRIFSLDPVELLNARNSDATRSRGNRLEAFVFTALNDRVIAACDRLEREG